MQGAAAESATSFARYAASLLPVPAAIESATPPAGSIQQVARRLSSILQDAMLGRHGDVTVSVNEGVGGTGSCPQLGTMKTGLLSERTLHSINGWQQELGSS